MNSFRKGLNFWGKGVLVDPLFGLGLLKLFLDTVDDGPVGAAKDIATMGMGPVGTAIDAAGVAWESTSHSQGFGEQMAELLVSCDDPAPEE